MLRFVLHNEDEALKNHWLKQFGRVLLIVAWFVSGFGAALATTTEQTPLIIDTDMTVDDIIAVAYLLRQPNVQIKAIIVDDNASSDCRFTLPKLHWLLQNAHQSSIPIACGASQAIGLGHRLPQPLRHDINLQKVAPHALKPSNSFSRHGTSLLVATLLHAPKPLSLLCLGSLTNLALALQQRPDIKHALKRVFIMGGAIHVAGNIPDFIPNAANRAAEWNLYFDPVAAKAVFAAGLPIYLIPLDTTQHAPITMRFLRQLAALPSSSFKHLLHRLLRPNEHLIQQGKLFFWDPLAAAISVDPSLCRWHTYTLAVAIKPVSQIGALRISPDAPPTRVCQLQHWKPSRLLTHKP